MFKRSLAQHPGHGTAALFSLMSGVAGAQSGGLRGALVGTLVMAAFCWTLVIATAWEMRKLHR